MVDDDPDATRQFTEQETMLYNPQPCPVCGQTTMVYSFTDSSSMGSAERTYMRTRGRCSNRRCALNGGDQGTPVN
jgi:hypothetical protein